MANEMFGAPGGISQAETDQRQNVMGGLLALHKMGEIEQQPSEKALKEAHARYYNAEALDKETNAMQDLALAGAAQGVFQNGTPGTGTPSSGSMADPIFALAKFAGGKGFTKKAVDLYKKGVDIVGKEATIAANQASAALRQLRTEKIQNDQDAALAAGVTDQPSYDQMRMVLQGRGEDTSWMPQDYSDPRAQQLLKMTVSQGVTANEQLKRREEKLLKDAQIKSLDARATASRAAADVYGQRATLLRQQIDDITKNGGDTTSGARELRKSRREALAKAETDRQTALKLRADAQAARDRKDAYSLVDADKNNLITNPDKRVIGRAYNLPSGVYIWSAQGWTPLRKPAQAAVKAATDATDTNDDSEGDDDGDD